MATEYNVYQIFASVSLTAALTFCGFYVRSLLSRINDANAQLLTMRAEVFAKIEKIKNGEEERCSRCQQAQHEFEKEVLQRLTRLEEKIVMAR